MDTKQCVDSLISWNFGNLETILERYIFDIRYKIFESDIGRLFYTGLANYSKNSSPSGFCGYSEEKFSHLALVKYFKFYPLFLKNRIPDPLQVTSIYTWSKASCIESCQIVFLGFFSQFTLSGLYNIVITHIGLCD